MRWSSSSDQRSSAGSDFGGFGDTDEHEFGCVFPTVCAARDISHAQNMRTTNTCGPRSILRLACDHVAVGMHCRGYDVQLTQYNERGWRATFYTTGMEHSPHERDGHRVGADAVVRGAECGVGCAEQNSEHAGTMTAPACSEFCSAHPTP